jgi:hypothetical protein
MPDPIGSGPPGPAPSPDPNADHPNLLPPDAPLPGGGGLMPHGAPLPGGGGLSPIDIVFGPSTHEQVDEPNPPIDEVDIDSSGAVDDGYLDGGC